MHPPERIGVAMHLALTLYIILAWNCRIGPYSRGSVRLYHKTKMQILLSYRNPERM